MDSPVYYGLNNGENAHGSPGIPPRWTSSAKTGVGTSISRSSRVWFTISHGILNEIYYPRLDLANVRDMEFLVADGKGFFSEEKRNAKTYSRCTKPGVPEYLIENTQIDGKYKIRKEILTDPDEDTLIQRVTFLPAASGLNLYVLLSPHINNSGYGNDAWIGEYKGTQMMFARRDNITMALCSSTGFSERSCGYVGFSDGWQDISKNGKMELHYNRATDGNVAMTARINVPAETGTFVLALGFGSTPEQAALSARSSILKNFDTLEGRYVDEWTLYQKSIPDLSESKDGARDLFRSSTSVLRVHESKEIRGCTIASLSIPWGASKGDEDLGGYHLVWPRDLVETAGGFIACGEYESARRILFYLISTQEADGHWPQNMWLDGKPYWSGIQIDETAFPILLADQLRRSGQLGETNPWPMIRLASEFILKNGPVTSQDRWEEDGGYSPFTLAVEIAALLAAADFAAENGEKNMAKYLIETADSWNSMIERWTYVGDNDTSRKFGIDGYYIRIAPPEEAESSSPATGFVPIKNRPPGQSYGKATHIISPDALALVRFGLRSAADKRITDTVRIIDAMLRTDVKTGVVWHRYNGDGYGEHRDGKPFDGTGIGRGWPLLAGERAHYEIARGNPEAAEFLRRVIENQTSDGMMIPEQVWDSDDIPKKGLYNGKPSGSAMPLVWAHAEYLKLLRSLHDGKIFDMPPQPVERYQNKSTTSRIFIWKFNNKCREIQVNSILRIEVQKPAVIHWSADNWASYKDDETIDTGLGVYHLDLDTTAMKLGGTITFTFKWIDTGSWEGRDFQITLGE